MSVIRDISPSPLEKEEGILASSAIRDITERKQFEEGLKRTMGELQESESRYRHLLASVTDYIYTVKISEGQAVSTFHGPGCENVTGYTSKECVNDTYLWYRMVHEGDRDAVVRQAAMCVAGKAAPLEHRIIHKDGSLRWVRNTPVLHKDDKGRVTEYDGLITDITERKQAEERIAQLNRARAILGGIDRAIVHIPDQQELLDEICRVAVEQGGFKLAWIGMVSPDESVRLVAKAGLTGYLDGIRVVARHDEPEGRGPVGTAIRENRPVVIEDIDSDSRMAPWDDRARQFGLRYVAAFPIRIKDKVTGSFQVYAQLAGFFDENELSLLIQVSGDISFALTAIEETAELERTEAALRNSEHRLRLALEAAQIGDWELDLVSQTACRSLRHGQIFGYADPLPEWSYALFLKHVHPEDRARVDHSFQESVATGRNWYFEFRIIRPDQTVRWIWACGSVIKDDSGQRGQMLGMVGDITERKVAEEKLRESQMLLINTEKMETIGRLAAGVAHEVKNPLAISRMSLDYLSHVLPEVDGTVAGVLKDMGDAIGRADTIIRGLLDFSAAEELDPKPEDLNSVIEKATLMVKHDRSMNHVQLVTNLDRDLPPVVIDRNKVVQAFVNLFTNSIDAMPDGGTLAVRSYFEQPSNPGKDPGSRSLDGFYVDDSHVVVEIEDSGSGIPPDKLSKIFDPFFTTKPPGKGTGLGLTVTQKIIELHGGSLEINNRPEGGIRSVLKFQATIIQ